MENKAFAFFDVDDTLLSVKSMFVFQEYWYDHVDSSGKDAYTRDFLKLRQDDTPRETINRSYYKYFSGREASVVKQESKNWFEAAFKSNPDLFHRNVVRILHQHQQNGIKAVLVTGSFPELVAPVANYLSVDHVLSTTMEIESGKFTGEILPPQTIGVGKKDALTAFLERMKVDSSDCFAYGDDISDRFMLASVGKPTVVAGCQEMEEHAKSKGWPIISPQECQEANKGKAK